MAEIQDEYIQWPGPATFPGPATYPAYDASATGNQTVHSHKGWEWEAVDNPFQQAAASLAQAAIETAVQRSRSVFGQVYYQRGNATDPPDFPGTAPGDTCRIQDPGTLDIVAEWAWNGATWERSLVSGQQISNLDVGRLTAGSAAINELAARRIAGDIGQFLQVKTDQLVVSGEANLNTAVVQELWAKVVHGGEGEFEKIRAGLLSGNAFVGQTFTGGTFEGQVITGAQIQTAKTGGRIIMNPSGMFAYNGSNEETFRLESQSGNIRIYGTIGLRDNWSVAEFTDFTDEQDSRNGAGLHFTSRLRNYSSPGRIYIREYKANSAPQLVFKAPALSGDSPSLIFWAGEFSVAGFAGGTGKFKLTKDGMYFNNGTDRTGLRVERDYFTIRPFAYADRAVWGDNEQIVVGYDSQHYSIWQAGGMFTIGGKNFVMRVPRLTEERGMWLRHTSTESPHHGIEYWQNIVLDSNGDGVWPLPEYLPLIASPTAPRVVLCSPDRGTAAARLDTSAETWAVRVTGQPGANVAVLLKLGRILDDRTDENGNVTWRDAEAEDPVWVLPCPYTPDPKNENRGLPGDVYGPPTREAAQAAAGVV